MTDNGHLFDVTGKSALITGATGAFGGAAACGLARGGANLTLAGGSSPKLEALQDELRQAGVAVEIVNRRPETEEDAEAMVAAAARAHGGIDVVVTASGVNKVELITEQSVEDWQVVMDAMSKGPGWCVAPQAGT